MLLLFFEGTFSATLSRPIPGLLEAVLHLWIFPLLSPSRALPAARTLLGALLLPRPLQSKHCAQVAGCSWIVLGPGRATCLCMRHMFVHAGGDGPQAPVGAVGMNRFPRGLPVDLVMALGLLCQVMRLLCLALPMLLLDLTLCFRLSCIITA